MGPTTGSLVESPDSGAGVNNNAKKKGIRRLLTPAIFTGGGDHKNNKVAASDAGSGGATPAATAVHNNGRQNKTIIETAFVNNNHSSDVGHNNSNGYNNNINTNNINNNNNNNGNNATAYRLQQQRAQYVQALNRHVNRAAAHDFRSRSVSPGSFDRDVNANNNYGGVGRRADSACSLSSSSSSTIVPDYHPRDGCRPASSSSSSPQRQRQMQLQSPSGRRSAPIVPYSQYYSNNRNGVQYQQQQQQRPLLMPVGAQVKISVPAPSTSAYATAVRQQQQQQQQQIIYGNVPATASPVRPGPFVRGSPQRATIGCARESPSRQSTIYETDEPDATAAQREKRFQPIFKRGALQAADDATASAAGPKRVSFSPPPSEQPVYWPTRKGPSPQPPTRSRSSAAADSPAADRPLPPVPKRSPSTSAVYGTLRSPAGQQNRWWPPSPQNHHQHHYQQSGSESGSEAGEVQRILHANRNGHLAAVGKCIVVTLACVHVRRIIARVIYRFLNERRPPLPRFLPHVFVINTWLERTPPVRNKRADMPGVDLHGARELACGNDCTRASLLPPPVSSTPKVGGIFVSRAPPTSGIKIITCN